MQDEKTYGQKLVRAGFNPSESEDVNSLKTLAAASIDKNREIADKVCQVISGEEGPASDRVANVRRWSALATTYYETAAMYAVKAATA